MADNKIKESKRIGKRFKYRSLPTIERVRELFIFDEGTGLFIKRSTGMPVGFTDSCGYRGLCIDYVLYKAHRVAWVLMYGEWPDKDIDHIDGNRSNNCKENLRLATPRQNACNVSTRKGKSGYLGVCFHKYHKKWIAQIRVNSVMKFIGYFECKHEAAAAYNEAAKAFNGEFASLNVIQNDSDCRDDWEKEQKLKQQRVYL